MREGGFLASMFAGDLFKGVMTVLGLAFCVLFVVLLPKDSAR